MLHINIEKSPIPLIWVDSSIIIKMAKIKVGEKIDDLSKKRMQFLCEKIKKATLDRKIICPRADQAEEFEYGERLEAECRDIQDELSLGIALKHGVEIEDFYVMIFMKAYVDKVYKINIGYRDLFRRDPVEELERKTNQKFRVRVEIPTPQDFVDNRRAAKQDAHEMYEDLRNQNILKEITFQQQLEREYQGTCGGLIEKIKRFESKLRNNKQIEYSELLGIKAIDNYLALWQSYKGEPSGFKGLFKFFLSDFHKQIPKIEIECNLYAKILTNRAPVKTGDSSDIQQLSSVLPFFDLVITDKTMKSHIESFGFHKKYRTKVFALKHFGKIEKFFEKFKE